jgi:RimJ/RimL family protein N-acetyltransferase
MIFDTERLIIRKANPTDEDVNLLYNLWTNPNVMRFVGFPYGLRITKEEIKNNARMADENDSEFDKYLIVELKETGALIGECKLGFPNDEGISQTDVKLDPKFWGNGYGTEVKRGLVDYLFTHTDCNIIQATPNKKNIASQRMQEDVGGIKVDEAIYRFPKEMRDYTEDVECFVYHVYRETWEKRFNSSEYCYNVKN